MNKRIDFNQFKNYHSEIIMFCQCIEYDLKIIYSYMCEGNQQENFKKLEKTTLGTLVKMLKELDNSDGELFISNDDYNFLKQMAEKRNYWCHRCFIDFIYNKNFANSKDYKKVCNKLQRDHGRLKRVSDSVEKVRSNAVKTYKR